MPLGICVQGRDHAIDIARGIAMLLMICGHCTGCPAQFKIWLYSFHMPLFFFLSGMVFNPDKYESFWAFLMSRVKSLLVPFLTLGFILWFWLYVFRNPENFLTAANLRRLINHLICWRGSKRYFGLWFIPCLFCAEIIVYAIVRVAKKGNTLILSAILHFLCLIAGCILLKYWKGGYVWNIDVAPVAAGFIGLGFCLRLCAGKPLARYLFKPVFIPVSLTLNCLFLYFNHHYNAKSITKTVIDLYASKTGNIPLYILGSLAGIWFALCVAHTVGKSRKLESIGRNTLVFYALHRKPILDVFDRILNTLLAGMKTSFFSRSLHTVLAVSLSCIMLSMCADLINRHCPWILGRFKTGTSSAHGAQAVPKVSEVRTEGKA